MFYINVLILTIFVLLSVAFLTLLERSILGYFQNRKSPIMLGLLGFVQPFSDGIKLFMKEQMVPTTSIFFNFFSLSFSLLLSLILWLFLSLYY